MYLHLTHPEIPTCQFCQEHFVEPPLWKPATRAGQVLKRLPGAPLPCWKCPKSRDGQPNPGAELSGRNARAYALYLAVRAGEPMPDDPIVVRNCALIQQATEHAARYTRQSEVVQALTLMFGKEKQ